MDGRMMKAECFLPAGVRYGLIRPDCPNIQVSAYIYIYLRIFQQTPTRTHTHAHTQTHHTTHAYKSTRRRASGAQYAAPRWLDGGRSLAREFQPSLARELGREGRYGKRPPRGNPVCTYISHTCAFPPYTARRPPRLGRRAGLLDGFAARTGCLSDSLIRCLGGGSAGRETRGAA
jgi:hypothetical protein